jgi:hypothetical protein
MLGPYILACLDIRDEPAAKGERLFDAGPSATSSILRGGD